jgi:predicted esterase
MLAAFLAGFGSGAAVLAALELLAAWLAMRAAVCR